MKNYGIYKFIFEFIMTTILVNFFPFPLLLEIKLIALYFIIQTLMGRYNESREQPVVIWNELKPLMIGDISYLLCTLLLTWTGLEIGNFKWDQIVLLFCFWLIHFVLNLLMTHFLYTVLSKRFQHNAMVIGGGEPVLKLEEICKNNDSSLIHVVGYVLDQDELSPEETKIQAASLTCPVYAMDELEEAIRSSRVDTVIIAMPEIQQKKLKQIKNRVIGLVDTIKYVPHIEGLITVDTHVDDFDGMLLISTPKKTVSILERVVKRTIDLCGSFVGLLTLLPLTIYVKLLNRKENDNGPVFYTQERIGKDGKTFTIYKYRSMIENADQKLKQLMEEDESIRKEYQTQKKLSNDPRITKAGHFLRETSLDEFPQFINVFKGEMSLIGPRPYLPREKEDMGEYYKEIIQSKPGLTGMWQTHGRSSVSFEKRLELDEYYAYNQSVWLDIILLVRTFKNVLARRGAK